MKPLLKTQDYIPPAPVKKYRIGLIGCGGIANGAHLPAYRNMGFEVVSCTDISLEAAKATAAKWNIPHVAKSTAELLANPKVEIVDLAIHNAGRVELVERIAAAGKHIFIQKPFAHNLADAEAMCNSAEAHRVKLAVNQQSRWAPAHRATKVLLDRGVIGRLYWIQHNIRGHQDDAGTWYVTIPYFTLIDHGIHYIDLARFWAGKEANFVTCSMGFAPKQICEGPMIYNVGITFSKSLTAALTFNNVVKSPNPWRTSYVLDGDKGSIFCDGSTLRIAVRGLPEIIEHPTVGSWFPDAFGYSMADFMNSLTTGTEAEVSGRRNLGTMKIVQAALEAYKTQKGIKI